MKRSLAAPCLLLTVATVGLVTAVELLAQEGNNPPRGVPSRAGAERDDNVLKMKLCWCPPGRFRMGSPLEEPDREEDKEPVPKTVSHGFWLGKYEVTQQEFQKVMGRNRRSWFSATGEGKERVVGQDTSR